MLHMICDYTVEDRHHMDYFSKIIPKFRQCRFDELRELFFIISEYQDIIKNEDFLEKSKYMPSVYNYLYSINFEINPGMLLGKEPPSAWYMFTPQECSLLQSLKTKLDINPIFSAEMVDRYVPIVKRSPKLDIIEKQYAVLLNMGHDYHILNKCLVNMFDKGYFLNEPNHTFLSKIQVATQLSIPLTDESASLIEEIPLCINS